MRLLSTCVTTIGAMLAFASSAVAEEQMRPLAQSGKWATLAHHESLTAAPDVCLTMSQLPQGMVAFRRDLAGFQVRVLNQNWALPIGVKGAITLVVGPVSKGFEIDDNTDQMVSASVPEDDAVAIFAAMDKASTMLVTAGKAKVSSISLAGSTKATNAFRTCAGLKSPAAQGGTESNPF